MSVGPVAMTSARSVGSVPVDEPSPAWSAFVGRAVVNCTRTPLVQVAEPASGRSCASIRSGPIDRVGMISTRVPAWSRPASSFRTAACARVPVTGVLEPVPDGGTLIGSLMGAPSVSRLTDGASALAADGGPAPWIIGGAGVLALEQTQGHGHTPLVTFDQTGVVTVEPITTAGVVEQGRPARSESVGLIVGLDESLDAGGREVETGGLDPAFLLRGLVLQARQKIPLGVDDLLESIRIPRLDRPQFLQHQLRELAHVLDGPVE